jgi:rfaE bifunctional protein kinase chain/domain/rfaE bifunctional protein nucleotidyltransferase chain/domain
MVNKIVNLEDLEEISLRLKKEGNKIVHCHGVFDLLHVGHIKHFAEAKKKGDILIVTLTSDEFVNKGPNRPAFKITHRLESISSLEDVDYVAENNWPTAEKTIQIIKPDIYFKGPDYKENEKDVTGNIKKEISSLKKYGGKIEYSKSITFSSSNLINKYSDLYNEDQKNFLKKISSNFDENDFVKSFKKFSDLKILVIGETIIDQYIFCEAIGKSGKEPMLVLRELESKNYLGGAAAVANHLSEFSNNISLLTCIGQDNAYSEFISNNLDKKIKPKYLKKKDSPTILKKRFIDKVSGNKTLGVYSLNDENLEPSQEKVVLNHLKNIKKYDLVIVADYGHGFITKKIANLISKTSPFLSLNAQINSSNSGFHSLNKYSKCDSIIINESELRHEMRSRQGDLRKLMLELSQNHQSNYVVVTRGNKGSLLLNYKKNEFIECPAFASKLVDKVGSGDAMLPILSMSLKSKLNDNVSLWFGSLAAAQSVESISNSKYVDKTEMLKTIQHALK